MEVIFIVLPLALVLAAVACAAFCWAVNHGQYDDLDTPPLRALLDDSETWAGRANTGANTIRRLPCDHQ
jgi:cbb3-type cytochrome oxidase maturation protein